MLPKKNRIPKEDFPAPQKQGFRVFSPLFSAVIYKNDTGVQVAVVVSKKTAKTAVVRNRIRRRVYSAIGGYYENFLYPALLVIYPKKESSIVLFATLKAEIEKALRGAKLL